MLSKVASLSKSSIPLLIRGSDNICLHASLPIHRNYRSRTFAFEHTELEMGQVSNQEPQQVKPEDSTIIEAEERKISQPCNFEELCDKQILDDCNQNPYSSIIQESDNIYRNITGEEVLSNTPFVEKKNVSALSFEDEFFRLKDEASARYFEDNVDDTLDQANTTSTDEEVTYVAQEDSKEFFDRILSMDANEVLSEEEKKRISIVREEKKEEEKVIKRNTWFNFMPAKEKPEGMFGSYNSDQIYSSMVFDLLSRNAEEVYKYEKDDLFLNEEILKHTKMPEPVQAPSIPLYPNFEEYAKWVTFAVNRNSHYSMEEKQKVVDILARLGSLDSEMDESPKTEFKEKKYL